MTPEDVIDYVTKTPDNTNPNVLRSMLKTLIDDSQPLSPMIVVEYDVTTYEEVATAIDNEQLVGFPYDGTALYLFDHLDETKMYFKSGNSIITLDNTDAWSDPIDVSPVFNARYGTTTFAEIAAAYQGNRMVQVNVGNDIYVLSYIAYDTGAEFAHPEDSGNSFVGVSINDEWSRYDGVE